MLCIGRNESETVTIRHNGETLIVGVIRRGGTGDVRLSFDGPRSFEIVRSELLLPSRTQEGTECD